MSLSWNEIKARAIAFAKEWEHEASEDAEAKTFWDEFFNVFGVHRRRIASFEVPIKREDGSGGFIDLLWKGILLVEHKSRGKDLDRALGQARDYFPGLKDRDLPRYVLVSDFEHFRLAGTTGVVRHDLQLGSDQTQNDVSEDESRDQGARLAGGRSAIEPQAAYFPSAERIRSRFVPEGRCNGRGGNTMSRSMCGLSLTAAFVLAGCATSPTSQRPFDVELFDGYRMGEFLYEPGSLDSASEIPGAMASPWYYDRELVRYTSEGEQVGPAFMLTSCAEYLARGGKGVWPAYYPDGPAFGCWR